MSQGSDARRPDDRRHESAPEEQQRSQDDLERTSQAGGDAPAAGSIEEREAVARDTDETWKTDPDG